MEKYQKQTWVDGSTTVNAAMMQHMEAGIESVTDAINDLQDVGIGTVTSGETASASITDGKLNLVLPKGDKGETGAAGPQGAQGPKGDSGAPGLSDTDKTHIVALFQNAAFGSTEMQAHLTALKTSWGISSGDTPDTPATVPVTGVALSKTSLSLTVGSSATLTATVSPSNATDKTVSWTVSPSGYATVSGGVVKAVKAGSCTVTATAGGKSARCSVTVAAAAAAENTNPFPSLTPSYLLASPKTFVPANKNYIDTGVKLFSSIDPKPSFTILFEAQGGEGLSAVANTYVAMHCMEESKPWPGMALQALSSGAMQLPCYSSKPELGTVAEWKADKHRMAIRMDAGNLSGWRPTSGKADWGAVDGLTTAVDKTLLIGCYQESDGTKGRFWDGTFYQIVVYPSALTDAQITGWVNGTTTTEDTVSLSESQLLLRVGDTYTLTAEASGDVTWSASPSGVVSVADGVLTVQGEGSCIVTATVGKASAQCTVSAVASTGTLLRKLPEAKTFASAKGDRVTTGLKLFESIDPKPSYTILCDFQLDAGADLTKAPILYDCATEDSSVHGLSLSMWNGGRLGVTLYGFSNSINVSSSVSERHKFALQLKEGQKKVWLDGTATWGGFADISGYTTTADAELLLGCDQGHNRLLDGTIYRFEVHNSILSEDEITTWMNAEG